MEFKVFNLGLVDFKRAWEFQREIFQEVKNGLLESGLILCQHYPVITLARTANKKNLLISEEELELRGIQLCEIERGGDIAYHGPGQLMVYPIFNLNYLKKDIHLFLRQLESITIALLSDFGIEASRYQGLTGVWVRKEKIVSIGIAIRNWITFHGLSINVKKDDLANFRLIRPCGMDIEMTSLEAILSRDIEMDRVKDGLIRIFRDTLSVNLKEEVAV